METSSENLPVMDPLTWHFLDQPFHSWDRDIREIEDTAQIYGAITRKAYRDGYETGRIAGEDPEEAWENFASQLVELFSEHIANRHRRDVILAACAESVSILLERDEPALKDELYGYMAIYLRIADDDERSARTMLGHIIDPKTKAIAVQMALGPD